MTIINSQQGNFIKSLYLSIYLFIVFQNLYEKTLTIFFFYKIKDFYFKRKKEISVYALHAATLMFN